MARLRRFLYRPTSLGFFFLLVIFLLWVAPPFGEIFPNAVDLQEWLRKPVFGGIMTTATRAEAIFSVALFVAFGVSSWNWTDAMLDFEYQRRRRPQNNGDYLAARANFRRESYRLWRLSSMCLLAMSLLFNWQLSTLFVTFGLLVFAYSEAVNSSLDRLYRLGAQEAFRAERVKRMRALELARIARSQAATETARADKSEAREAVREAEGG
jgi:hypothetical protein